MSRPARDARASMISGRAVDGQGRGIAGLTIAACDFGAVDFGAVRGPCVEVAADGTFELAPPPVPADLSGAFARASRPLWIVAWRGGAVAGAAAVSMQSARVHLVIDPSAMPDGDLLHVFPAPIAKDLERLGFTSQSLSVAGKRVATNALRLSRRPHHLLQLALHRIETTGLRVDHALAPFALDLDGDGIGPGVAQLGKAAGGDGLLTWPRLREGIGRHAVSRRMFARLDDRYRLMILGLTPLEATRAIDAGLGDSGRIAGLEPDHLSLRIDTDLESAAGIHRRAVARLGAVEAALAILLRDGVDPLPDWLLAARGRTTAVGSAALRRNDRAWLMGTALRPAVLDGTQPSGEAADAEAALLEAANVIRLAGDQSDAGDLWGAQASLERAEAALARAAAVLCPAASPQRRLSAALLRAVGGKDVLTRWCWRRSLAGGATWPAGLQTADLMMLDRSGEGWTRDSGPAVALTHRGDVDAFDLDAALTGGGSVTVTFGAVWLDLSLGADLVVRFSGGVERLERIGAAGPLHIGLRFRPDHLWIEVMTVAGEADLLLMKLDLPKGSVSIRAEPGSLIRLLAAWHAVPQRLLRDSSVSSREVEAWSDGISPESRLCDLWLNALPFVRARLASAAGDHAAAIDYISLLVDLDAAEGKRLPDSLSAADGDMLGHRLRPAGERDLSRFAAELLLAQADATICLGGSIRGGARLGCLLGRLPEDDLRLAPELASMARRAALLHETELRLAPTSHPDGPAAHDGLIDLWLSHGLRRGDCPERLMRRRWRALLRPVTAHSAVDALRRARLAALRAARVERAWRVSVGAPGQVAALVADLRRMASGDMPDIDWIGCVADLLEDVTAMAHLPARERERALRRILRLAVRWLMTDAARNCRALEAYVPDAEGVLPSDPFSPLAGAVASADALLRDLDAIAGLIPPPRPTHP